MTLIERLTWITAFVVFPLSTGLAATAITAAVMGVGA